MNKLRVVSVQGQIVTKRLKVPYILKMIVWILAFLIVAYVPSLGYFRYHQASGAFFYFIAFLLPLLLLYLYRGFTYFRPCTYVFDKTHDFVTCNDVLVCALSEMQSVHVEKSSFSTSRFIKGSDTSLRLSFLTKSGTDAEVERSSLYGPSIEEMKRVGKEIADYAGVLLVKPEY